jgi:hypothetical protein
VHCSALDLLRLQLTCHELPVEAPGTDAYDADSLAAERAQNARPADGNRIEEELTHPIEVMTGRM